MEKPCNLIQRGIIDSIVSFSIISILHCISHVCVCVCEIFDLVFTFKMKHPVREHLCMYTWLARDSFPELAFFSPFPQQCQLLQSISFRWNGEFEFPVPSTLETCIWTFRDRTRWICLFVSTFRRNLVSPRYHHPFERIEVNVLKRKDRKFIFTFFLSFFLI